MQLQHAVVGICHYCGARSSTLECPESRDEKHAPVTIQQTDNQHRHAAKEPVAIAEACKQLVIVQPKPTRPRRFCDPACG